MKSVVSTGEPFASVTVNADLIAATVALIGSETANFKVVLFVKVGSAIVGRAESLNETTLE